MDQPHLALHRADLAADPVEQFGTWFDAAVRAGQSEPEAMALATCDSSSPAVRYVLLRGWDERGFVFYSNRRSAKGQALESNPQAAAVFRWEKVDRQVRLAGRVEHVDDSESDRYFASRLRGSQIAAWASDQSRPAPGRAALEERYAEMENRFGDKPVPRPPWWGGYRIVAETVEFWQQGRFRMHDRFLYRRDGAAQWSIERLYP